MERPRQSTAEWLVTGTWRALGLRCRWKTAAALCAGSAAARPAQAHEVLPGLTGFPSLLLHPFVTVETTLLMIGLALVIGMGERGRSLVPLGAALLLGAAVGVLLQPEAVLWPGLWRAPLALSLVLGGLAAWGRPLPSPVTVTLVLAVAVVIGVGLPPERPGLIGRFEAATAVVFAILLGVLLISTPRAILGRFQPVPLAGQVLGAWIVAIALLGMAIWFR